MSMAGYSPALAVYRLLTRMLEPLVPRLLDMRVRQGKENPERVDERLGLTGAPRPDGPLVWLHGVSVGEALSILPLAQRIRRDRPDVGVVVTTGTVTSAEVLGLRLPPGATHQFAPVDGPAAVAAFLDHWRPDLGVLAESELWPNLLVAASERGLPMALVSARITEKTARGWRRAPRMAARLLAGFAHVWPQDDVSAQRLAALGARVDGEINLKLSGEALPYDRAAFAGLSARIGDRPVVVAASTHEGEETAIARALGGLAPGLLLIIVPRHPERGPGVAQALAAEGRRVARRGADEAIGEDTDIYVADTLGELGLFLRLADVAVMGGAFGPAPVGGHNPLEPARLGKPVVTGPDMANWAGITRALEAAGGLRVVASPVDLPGAVGPLLADLEAARAMGERARRAAADAEAGLDRLWRALQAHLTPPVRGPGR